MSLLAAVSQFFGCLFHIADLHLPQCPHADNHHIWFACLLLSFSLGWDSFCEPSPRGTSRKENFLEQPPLSAGLRVGGQTGFASDKEDDTRRLRSQDIAGHALAFFFLLHWLLVNECICNFLMNKDAPV